MCACVLAHFRGSSACCCPLATRSTASAPAMTASLSVLTDDTDREEIRELMTESYRILAPRKLTALLD